MILSGEMIRTNCNYCDETYDMGAVIHTCRKKYKSFHDFGVCPCTENCKDFDGRSDYQRGYDDAMNDKKKTNAYLLNEFWDDEEGCVTLTTYGVFTSFKQAFYVLYELINHRLLAYRSHGNQVVFFNHYDYYGHQMIYITIHDYEYNNKIEYSIKSFEMDKVEEDMEGFRGGKKPLIECSANDLYQEMLYTAKKMSNYMYGVGAVKKYGISSPFSNVVLRHYFTCFLEEVKDIKFSGPATIVFWKDGTKTVVKCQEGEHYDPKDGIKYALLKKLAGGTSNQASKMAKKYDEWLEKWIPEDGETEEKDDGNKH